MKKVLILHASARANGNTAYLAKVAKETAEANGHKVKVIEATSLKIQPCRDCKTCFKAGRPCTFKDDFSDVVAPELEKADAVIFVEPLYWFESPAAMRLIVDKFYAYFISGKGLTGKEAALIATCGGSNDFLGIVHPYEQTIKLMGWKNLGIVTQDQMNDVGAIEKTDAADRVRTLIAKL